MRKYFALTLALCLISSLLFAQASVPSISNMEIVEFIPRTGVTEADIAKSKADFLSAYSTVDRLVGKADKLVTINMYRDTDELYDNLYDEYGYKDAYTYLKKYNAIPRMNADYVMWYPVDRGIDFLAHEYAHRVFEHIAGLGFQNRCKWIDEGYATYIGFEALKEASPAKYAEAKEEQFAFFQRMVDLGNCIDPVQLRSGSDWQALRTSNRSSFAYIQSYVMVDQLIESQGTAKLNAFLVGMKGSGDFESVFQETFGIGDLDFAMKVFSKYRGNIRKYLQIKEVLIETRETQSVLTISLLEPVPKRLRDDEAYLEYDILIDSDGDRDSYSWGPAPSLANDLGVDYVASLLLMKDGYKARLLNKTKGINKEIKYKVAGNDIVLHIDKNDLESLAGSGFVVLSRKYISRD